MAEDRSPHDLAVRRACLPEVMFEDDVSVALRVPRDAAREAILRGDCGAFFWIVGRIAVRREAFLASLEAREGEPGRGPLTLLESASDGATKRRHGELESKRGPSCRASTGHGGRTPQEER